MEYQIDKEVSVQSNKSIIRTLIHFGFEVAISPCYTEKTKEWDFNTNRY